MMLDNRNPPLLLTPRRGKTVTEILSCDTLPGSGYGAREFQLGVAGGRAGGREGPPRRARLVSEAGEEVTGYCLLRLGFLLLVHPREDSFFEKKGKFCLGFLGGSALDI